MDLNHTIVPSHDKVAASAWIADILGLTLVPPTGHFAPVRVNEQLTLDFDDAENVAHHHYAFHVSDGEFDAIFERVRAQGINTAVARRPTRIWRSTIGVGAAASTSGIWMATAGSC